MQVRVFLSDQTITGLWIGDYSLRVTHRSTGCSVEDNVRLTQEIVDFSVASTLQEDNTNCQAPFNGSIGGISVIYDGINVSLNRVGFQINGSDAVLNGGVLSGLSAGSYVLQADTLDCVSSSVSIIIADDLTLPNITDINVNIIPSTSCDEMSNPNGGIEVSPDGIFDDTGYSFVWHRGSIASPPTPISGETGRQLFLFTPRNLFCGSDQ